MLFWSQEALSALFIVFSGMYRLNYADQTYVPEDLLSWLVDVYQIKIFWEVFDSFQDLEIRKFIQLEFFKLDSNTYWNILLHLLFNIQKHWLNLRF